MKLWGVLGANDTTTDDGSATFATDINSSLLVGVALHELTHAMGRVPYGTPYSTSPDIFDFYRFSSPGVRVFNGASTASPAYFSLDGGITKLADYGQISDPSDFLNSGVQGYERSVQRILHRQHASELLRPSTSNSSMRWAFIRHRP